MDRSTLGLPVHHQLWSLLKVMSSESLMPSSHLILWHPLLLLPSIFHSIRVFSNESVLHIRWPKYWSFSCSISPSNEYSGLIGLVGPPCSPRDSQESSPTPQFKSINSSVLSFLYSPTFTSIHVGTTEYQNVQKLMYESGESESVSYSVMPNSLQPHEL